YSFAFHAGSLLKSFFLDWDATGPPAQSGVVDICAVHPNFYIVADRDARGTDVGHPYLTALLQDERARDVTWITHGKEIENYIPVSLLTRYLTEAANPRQPVPNK